MSKELINFVRKDCERSLSDNHKMLHSLRDQSILVTGGTGFMGKWIAEAISLLNEDYNFNIKLYLLSRNASGFKDTVPHLFNKSFIEFIDKDVRDVDTLPQDLSYVINAAGTPDNRKHSVNPLKVIDTICKGTNCILDACLNLPKLNRFIQISSSSIYGEFSGKSNRIKETEMGSLNCNSVNSAYSEGKRLAETICAVYRNQQKLPIIIIRPFAFIGPYQGLDKPWAINNFIRDSLLGGPIKILGNEETVRSYLYGSDMAVWLLTALANGKIGASYNIGGDESISLKMLANKIKSLFPQKIDILVKSAKEYTGTPSVSIPDTSLIKSDLNIRQVIDFDSALEKTIYWNKINTKKQ